MLPHLYYAEDPSGSGEHACAVTLVPTLDPEIADDDFEVLQDEKPEQEDLEIGNGEDYHFLFLVDRSYSMSGRRMEMARNALTLFIRSLPEGCKFSIISFGCSHSSDGDKVV